jgi:hypothetical protein
MTTPRESSQTQLSTADMAKAAESRTERPAAEHSKVERFTTERPATERPESQHTTDSGPVERRPQDRPEHAPLFVGNQAEDFRGRWSDIQASFVDEPRRAVEQADGLVAEVMQRLAQVFADERKKLEQQWDKGGETDTEELRQALRRYRSFFDRLLSM